MQNNLESGVFSVNIPVRRNNTTSCHVPLLSARSAILHCHSACVSHHYAAPLSSKDMHAPTLARSQALFSNNVYCTCVFCTLLVATSKTYSVKLVNLYIVLKCKNYCTTNRKSPLTVVIILETSLVIIRTKNNRLDLSIY